jgi:hypothetical protein
MKSGIDNKIMNRGIVVKQQEIILLASETNKKMEQSMENLDRNLESFKKFQMDKIDYIEKKGGRLEIDHKNKKETFIRYTE